MQQANDGRWLPRSLRDADSADYYTLRDGIPLGMQTTLARWTIGKFDGGWSEPVLREIERKFDLQLGSSIHVLMDLCRRDDQLWLDILDFLLEHPVTAYEREATEIADAMAEARMLWRPVQVAGKAYRLERHTSPELESLVSRVTGRPSDYLREAWSKQFGRHQQPDGAYRDAIRAIEAAIIPAMSLTVAEPTLGKALGTLKGNPTGYRVGLNVQGGFDGVMALWNSIQLLWKAQFDRHGTPDDDVPLNVSASESEHAVVLATSLVHALQNGLLQKA